MSNYTLSADARYMENHRAAQPLGAQSALCVAKTAQHGVILFSIDDAQALRVTVGQDGEATGWRTFVIIAGLAAQFAIRSEGGKFSVKAFDAIQGVDVSGVPQAISLLIALTVSSSAGSYDLVYLAEGLAADPNAAWLEDPTQIPWTARTYDYSGVELPSLTASTVNVADVEFGYWPGGAAFAVVTLVDPGDQLDRPFTISLDATQSTNVWTYLKPEQDYTELVDSALGQPARTVMPGIYKLYTYTSNGVAQRALTFKPKATQFPARFYAISQGATALTTVSPQASSLNYTHLLVADAGSLVLYPYDSQATNGQNYFVGTPVASNVTGSTLLSNVSALHAVAEGAVLSVWGVNGLGQIFYLQAAIDAQGGLSGWTTPLPLLSGVVRAAAYLSEQRRLTSLYAIVKDAQHEVEQLVELRKDPITTDGATHWTQQPIHLPATGTYVTLQTYTSRVLVSDAAQGLPTAAAVQITSDSTAVVEINGLVYTLTPDSPVTVHTDPSGALSLMQIVSTLGVPQYHFAVVDNTTQQAAPTGSLDLTTRVRQALAEYTNGGQLLAVKINVEGQSRPLLQGVSVDDADAIAQGLQHATSIQPAAARSVTSFALAPAHAPASLGSSVLVGLGDLVQALIGGFKSAAAWIESAGESLRRLVVKVGDTLFHAVIQTAEDVANAAVALFNAVKTTVEDVFQWLAFLFDWEAILDVKNQLVDLHTVVLNGIGSALRSKQASVDDWFAKMQAKLNPQNIANAASKVGSGSARDYVAAQKPNAFFNGQDTRSDGRLGWVHSQLSNVGSSSTSLTRSGTISQKAGAGAALRQDSSDLSTVLARFGQSIQSNFAAIGLNSGALIDGTMPLSQWVQSVGKHLESMGLALFQTFFDTAFDVLEEFGGAVLSGITAQIDIPVLSALYEDISGAKLSLLDATCLVQAVACSIVYKIVTNKNDLATVLAGVTNEFKGKLSQIAASIPQVNPLTSTHGFQELDVRQSADVPRSMARPAAGVTSAVTFNMVGDANGDHMPGSELAINIFRMFRAFSMSFLYFIPGPTMMSIDLGVRLVPAAIEAVADWGEAVMAPATFETLYPTLMLWALWGLAKSADRREEVCESVESIDSTASALLGVMAGVIGGVEDEDKAGPILNAVSEVAEAIAYYSKEAYPVASPITMAIAVFCAYGSGFVPLIGES